jgi:2,3-dihydroxybenzoate-AMP ligase
VIVHNGFDQYGGGYVGLPTEFVERYRRAGCWAGVTLGELLSSAAAEHGDRTALVDGPRRWTYRELDQRAEGLATGFSAAGLRPGDPVVLALPNVAEFVEIVFGLFRMGALPVFALPGHRESELRQIADQAGAAAVVTPDEHAGFAAAEAAARVATAVPSIRLRIVVGTVPAAAAGARPLNSLRMPPAEHPRPRATDLAFCQLSGGTTGAPKLIARTHDDHVYSLTESARLCRLDRDTVYLVALPAAHNFPLSSPGILGTLHSGGTVVLCPSPDPDTALRLIETERVTVTALVPPLAAVWAQAAPTSNRDLSSLRLLQVGGAKCGAELATRIRLAFDATLQQVFGMAEGLLNYTRLDDPENIVLHTQGRPLSPHDEIRVVDPDDPAEPDVAPGQVGALLTRGPYTIRGYFDARRPEVAAHNATAFTPEGFYRTGDLVRVTPEGYLVVVGRLKDQINRGGEKVAAEEVENHLLAHPDVLDAAVVAMPDRVLGERTCAYVLVKPGHQRPTPAQLRTFVRDRGVATFAVPDRVDVVDEFPATKVGKISKRELRAALTAGFADQPTA